MATDNTKTRTTQDTTRRVNEEYLQRYNEAIAENYESQMFYAQNQELQTQRREAINRSISEPARKKSSKGRTLAKWLGGGAAAPFIPFLFGGSSAKAAGFTTATVIIHKLF